MAVIVDLRAAPPAAVRFAASPLVELGSALHVLAEPDHHPDQQGWAASVRAAASGRLARDLDAFTSAVRAVRARFLLAPPAAGLSSWEADLERLRGQPLDGFADDLLRPLLRITRALPRRGVLADPAARDSVRRFARARGPATVQVVEELLTDPARVQARFLEFLDACWASFFAARWQAIQPCLAAELRIRADQAHRRGTLAALRRAGLLTTRRAGRFVLYQLDVHTLRRLGSDLADALLR